MASPRQIAIAGAGLAGCLGAVLLARRGYAVEVYERRPDPRGERVDFGRSINLALSARGSDALARAGLLERVLARSVPMRARAIHDLSGEVRYQAFGRHEGEYLCAIERHALNVELLQAAEAHPGVTLRFHQRLTGVDLAGMRLQLTDSRTGRTESRPFEALVAADGVHSAVRRALVEQELAEFAQAELDHGYKELLIPAERAAGMRRECLHLWPRRSFSMIANPNPDGSFTCTLFAPHRGEDGFDQLGSPQAVRRYFGQHFPDAAERMPTLVEDFLGHPTGTLPTVRGGPWHHEDKVLLLGDAAHALVPFFAQGMNSAFEDCALLSELLDGHGGRWDLAVPAFFRLRKPDADAIAEMTMQNYREIQDAIADPRFLLRKRLELELMRRYPQVYASMHVLVMFSRARYSFALACGALQESLLGELCQGLESLDQLDWGHVERRLAGYAGEVAARAGALGVELGPLGLTLQLPRREGPAA